MTLIRRWFFELGLGARMSVAGGRSGWTRLALIAAGVGIGVAVLLSIAALPAAIGAATARDQARSENPQESPPKGDNTLLIGIATTMFGSDSVHGRMLQPEGANPPIPPGVTTLPKPGQMIVSPALADLIRDNPLLAQRWDAPIVGTIGEQGLRGPADLAFYLGTDTLTEETGYRIDRFGAGGADDGEGTSPAMLLLGAVGIVVLLMPVMVFMASAVRFGGEARDRRLAALRLVGSDASMTRRIAAGETLAGAVLGLGLGAVLAVGAALAANRWATGALSFYLYDMRPVPALVALIVVAVPAVAVLVTLSAMRRVVVEPLGVVRLSTTVRRRLWWRLVLPVLGVALLWPLRNGLEDGSSGVEFQAAGGVALLLIGLALLLPWLVEATVDRLGGGSLAWELAIRRLQFDSGTAVRAVSGIAVSVAGVIALQGLVSGIESVVGPSDSATGRFHHQISPTTDIPDSAWTAALSKTPGVRETRTIRTVFGELSGDSTAIHIGDCQALHRYADMSACADGDVYGIAVPEGRTEYTLRDGGTWTPPAPTKQATGADSVLGYGAMLLVTTGAIAGGDIPETESTYAVDLDTSQFGALEQLRNTAARLDPQALVYDPGNATIADVMRTSRQGLLAGTIVLLVLIGASMLVNVAEQLRERRRVLAVLVAFGTRRRTLTGSVLYQATIPVLIGMALAVSLGSALAAVMMTAVDAPVTIDWFGIGTTSAVAVLVVLGTTAAALPSLMRLTRPGNLRNE
ncbi:ABC transporter permease [Actinoplanes derwentensis]|uniref:FtsX-like permease family protein n=1 Tax=Actinoplanes derwentensis TaxID=113562 RepID=A0A1H1SRP1_9ACTN|nr:ABC transporter permease [Actinoplanes derwentensis]GID83240.1 membrane protein [Actinoplanes derwentensis]SDS50059.1 FtsX-like permease family protein [Actinoplanes derwentensis]